MFWFWIWWSTQLLVWYELWKSHQPLVNELPNISLPWLVIHLPRPGWYTTECGEEAGDNIICSSGEKPEDSAVLATPDVPHTTIQVARRVHPCWRRSRPTTHTNPVCPDQRPAPGDQRWGFALVHLYADAVHFREGGWVVVGQSRCTIPLVCLVLMLRARQSRYTKKYFCWCGWFCAVLQGSY